MEALLTSFGLGMMSDHERTRRNVFYRMPPTMFELRGRQLAPDYGLLLLCDRVIVDAESFDRLATSHEAYDHVAEVLRALEQEGFIALEDYSARVKAAQRVIEPRVTAALERFDWSETLKESVALWRRFVGVAGHALQSTRNMYFHGMSDEAEAELSFYFHAVAPDMIHERVQSESAADAIQSRGDHSDVLRAYLTYVENNIELSRQFRAPIHDWADYGPFYRTRLGHSEMQQELESKTTAVGRLFSVTFPEFAPMRAGDVLKILRDKRLQSLRDIVSQAAKGEIVFDRDFAVRTLLQVIRNAKQAARFRTITSYALLPAGYLPIIGTPLTKAVEEAIGASLEHKIQEPFQWFYLLSEASQVAHGAQQ